MGVLFLVKLLFVPGDRLLVIGQLLLKGIEVLGKRQLPALQCLTLLRQRLLDQPPVVVLNNLVRYLQHLFLDRQ